MSSIQRVGVVGMLLALTAAASAEPLSGRVVDRKTGAPVEGAVVHVAGPEGFEATLSSGADGRYLVDVAPGRYRITFLHGKTRVVGRVEVEAGLPTKLDGRVDDAPDEVISLEHTVAPAVMPQPKDPQLANRAPAYTDKAIEQDAWTRAWLLLDVDERGVVTRLKFLKRPGYDLEPIAIRESFAVVFTPGRDDRGRPVRTLVVWPIEWVSSNWLMNFGNGMRTRMPALNDRGRNSAAYVPCKGSGPWQMTSYRGYRGYRDCSRADLSKAKTEAWILPGS